MAYWQFLSCGCVSVLIVVFRVFSCVWATDTPIIFSFNFEGGGYGATLGMYQGMRNTKGKSAAIIINSLANNIGKRAARGANGMAILGKKIAI